MQGSSPSSSGDSSGRSTISSTMLDRLKAQDAEAWSWLRKILGPAVYQHARWRGLQPADAEEIEQEVFTSVLRKLPDFRRDRPSDSFRGWVGKIAQNKIHDHFRRGKGQPAAKGGTDAMMQIQQIPDPDAGSANGASATDLDYCMLHRLLASIRGDFSDTTWKAFWETAVEGRSSAEVAAGLGIEKEAVRQAKCRVLRRAREEGHRLDRLA